MIELPGYHYVGLLGTPGNFGSVFHARNALSGQDVAIKHIDGAMTPAAIADWVAEAQAMAACRHENLVEILHAEVTPDGPALVMEYLPAGSVAAHYGDDPAPVGDVVQIVIDVCWGLHRLHLEGLTHRDIKPANLLIGDRATKIGDFGLAGGPNRVPDAIYIAHKPPEVAFGQPWSEVADVYSLGVTAWRLLWGDGASGRQEPDVLQEAMAGHWPDRGRWPQHVHKRLRMALRAAMDPDPSKRPQSAAILRSSLERARPVVSLVSDGNLVWTGRASGVEWAVAVDERSGGHYVETRRDLGSGPRKVAAGCVGPMTAAEATKAAGRVLQSIAAAGVPRVA